ncbi:hypothetical protein [Hymenobacter chitinivorans]|uniref:Uncharacterized protein n=1 Tax=Hymenobacter chitinivorans DSM 11115 TaxID=1121954 RepID=A0A2M9BL05_9BACT|nr:hypothetical protein [Hymenobacter chitinivorans]PJJ58600.1 hypothetical protein CLV45_0010 [Hymenobacter chitinivorans DSM 11115]
MLTAKQDNRLTAAENTLAALREDATPYQRDQALQDIIADLQQFTTDLEPLRQKIRPKATKGKTDAKTDRRELLAVSAGEVAGDLYAYATAKTDRPLQNAANHSYGTLLNLRATALTDTAQEILDHATTHAQALEKYDVTPERLAELKAALAAFSTGKNDPRQETTKGQAARLAIKAKFSELATLLEDRLDRSMRKYARSHPEFYHRVTAARQIIDRPGKQQSPGEDEHPPIKPE